MNLIATVVQGERDWSDIVMLVAVILFAIVTVIHLAARAVESALVSGGLCAVALALLLL